MAADRIIRWSTAGAVVGVAAVAAVASYEHAYDLVRAHGEVGWTARLVPLTVDGLIYASSMVMPRLSAPEGAVSEAGEVAAGPGHRGDAGAKGRTARRAGAREFGPSTGGLARSGPASAGSATHPQVLHRRYTAPRY